MTIDAYKMIKEKEQELKFGDYDHWDNGHVADLMVKYASPLQSRIAELEAALEQSHKCACMGAEIAEVFPAKFAGDWDCQPHPLLRKESTGG